MARESPTALPKPGRQLRLIGRIGPGRGPGRGQGLQAHLLRHPGAGGPFDEEPGSVLVGRALRHRQAPGPHGGLRPVGRAGRQRLEADLVGDGRLLRIDEDRGEEAGIGAEGRGLALGELGRGLIPVEGGDAGGRILHQPGPFLEALLDLLVGEAGLPVLIEIDEAVLEIGLLAPAVHHHAVELVEDAEPAAANAGLVGAGRELQLVEGRIPLIHGLDAVGVDAGLLEEVLPIEEHVDLFRHRDAVDLRAARIGQMEGGGRGRGNVAVLVPGGIRQLRIVDLAVELGDPVVGIGGVAVEAHREKEDVEGRLGGGEAEGGFVPEGLLRRRGDVELDARQLLEIRQQRLDGRFPGMFDEEDVQLLALELLPIDIGFLRRIGRESGTSREQQDGDKPPQQMSHGSHRSLSLGGRL